MWFIDDQQFIIQKQDLFIEGNAYFMCPLAVVVNRGAATVWTFRCQALSLLIHHFTTLSTFCPSVRGYVGKTRRKEFSQCFPMPMRQADATGRYAITHGKWSGRAVHLES